MTEPDESTEGLTSRAFSGAFVTGLGLGVQSLLQVGVLVVLARLVTPEEFGLVSAAGVVIAFCNLFVQVGVGPAIVQRDRLEQRHLDSGFTLSLVLGVVVGGIVVAAAPLVAAGFKMDRLTNVLRVLSISFVVAAPGVVAHSLLSRRLRFGVLAVLSMVSYLVGYGVVGTVLALLHLGVWALVVASLAQIVCSTAGALLVQRPRLRLALRRDAVRDLLGFGAGFTLAGIAGYFAENFDNMIVGRLLGARALGFYGRAFQFLSTPAQWLGMLTDRVLFPLMSRIQKERDRLEPAYRRCLSLVALGAVPLTVLLVVLAPEIVRVILGDGWTEVILPFQILAVGLLPRVSGKLAKSVAKATGAVYASAWRQALFAVLVAAGAWLGSRRGLWGVATGVTCAMVINYGLMAQLTLRATGLPWSRFFLAHAQGVATATVWLAVGWPSAYALRRADLPDIVVLAVVAALLVALLAGMWLLLPTFFLGTDGRWAAGLLRERLHWRPRHGRA
jgi:PST family polysaccharide transporter